MLFGNSGAAHPNELVVSFIVLREGGGGKEVAVPYSQVLFECGL